MNKNIKYKFKRFFIFRLKIKKIKLPKLNSLSKNKKNVFIYLALNKRIKDKEYIKDFMNHHKNLILTIERCDFKEWFKKNKDNYQKFIFLNNNMHVRHEYRWIRDQNYLSYLIN